jgi:hypothetical protein
MKFYSPKGPTLRSLCNKINPDEFIESMVKIGQIDKRTEDYGSDVYKLCHNSVAWILKQLKPTFYFFEVEIIVGSFEGKDHSWVKAGNYYIDLTLAQFIDCPKLAVSKAGEIQGYEPKEILSTSDYLSILFKENNL